MDAFREYHYPKGQVEHLEARPVESAVELGFRRPLCSSRAALNARGAEEIAAFKRAPNPDADALCTAKNEDGVLNTINKALERASAA